MGERSFLFFKKYIADFVYGATDGVVTTFAIISSAAGATLTPVVVLILGVANVLADGFSMASSNFLAERSDISVHGIQNDKRPWLAAVTTFCSFVIVGLIPLIPFILALFSDTVRQNTYEYSIVLTVIAFIFIGVARGKISGKNTLRSAIETLTIGGIAAVVAYTVGYLLKTIIGV